MANTERDARVLDRFVAELRDLFGEDLLYVALYGDAALPGPRPTGVALTSLVSVRVLTAATLRAARPHVAAWHRRGLATPLFMDPAYIESSLDVFPLEFLEISDRHRILWGEDDPFAQPAIDRENLRLQVEQEAKGKVLHLRSAYLGAGRSRRTLRRLLVSTPSDFHSVLAGMLALRSLDRPAHPQDFLGAVEAAFDVRLPTFRHLEQVRRGQARLQRAGLEPTFDAYLAEARALAQLADGL